MNFIVYFVILLCTKHYFIQRFTQGLSYSHAPFHCQQNFHDKHFSDFYIDGSFYIYLIYGVLQM